MLKDDNPRNRLIGIGLVCCTFLFFSITDTSSKWLLLSLPVVQVVWLRFASQVLIMSAILAPRHGRKLLSTRRPGLQLLRASMLLSMTAMNFVALRYLQLAETSAIQFTVPILVTVISVPLLGEKLDPRRWAAVLIGFAGVLLIVRPGTGGFHPAMLLALGNAVLYAFFNLLTRQLARSESPETTQFLSGLGPVVMMAPFALADWQPLESWLTWSVVALAGLSGGMGHYFNALAHRFAPASVLAPYLYLQIIHMIALGYLVFGDVPSTAVLAGAVVVIASGLYLFAYERRGLSRQPG